MSLTARWRVEMATSIDEMVTGVTDIPLECSLPSLWEELPHFSYRLVGIKR